MKRKLITAVIDSRIWLPADLPKAIEIALKKEFTHSNPEFYKKRSMGYSTWGVSDKIKTFSYSDDCLGRRFTLPRGGTTALRSVCNQFGYDLKWIDRRISCPVEFSDFYVDPARPELTLRPYQLECVANALRIQQGVCRAPTGSGKTLAALAFIHEAKERSIVIMRDRNLLEQWLKVSVKCLGLDEDEIGIIRGGRKYRPGKRLTLALQQSLYSKGNQLGRLLEEEPFGAVVVDEVQRVAAKTFLDVIDKFPSKYRIGFSADETRRDKKEFLIYDEIGKAIFDISRKELEEEGIIHKVIVRVIPTSFRADWYRIADPIERDFNQLIDEMIEDESRNNLIVNLIEEIIHDDETPCLAFTHRRSHARDLAVTELHKKGITSGLLLGGSGENTNRFSLDMADLSTGKLKVAVGTFNAIGEGHDVPIAKSGICLTPISSANPQFFGQVRGRICRTSKGKDRAILYYLWDKEVFPYQLNFIKKWNEGNIEVLDGEEWIRV
jgi:superfamily II DNA or RNA helicase